MRGGCLGTYGDFLPIPEGTLAVCADDQFGRVPIFRRSAPHGCGEVIEASEEGDGRNLEGAVSSGASVSPSETLETDSRYVSLDEVCEWSADKNQRSQPSDSFYAPLANFSPFFLRVKANPQLFKENHDKPSQVKNHRKPQ